jgi:uncharacterized membrane protein YkoI
MRARVVLTLALLALAKRSEAQTKVRVSDGEVTRDRAASVDRARLSARIPGIAAELRARIRVDGDSAQRIAMNDFGWSGRVVSVEIDEEDARVFWDVKLVPDTSARTVVRYRLDAVTGGILDIKEFTGIRGLAVRKP